MVNRWRMKQLRWQILSCVMALGIALLPWTQAAPCDAQNQPAPASAPAHPAGLSAGAELRRLRSAPAPANAASPAQSRSGQIIFHVKYISEGAVYLDAGRNAGLEEGMLLHVVHADPNGGTTDAVRFQGQESLADVRIFSVADTSSAAEIVTSQRRSRHRRHRLSGYRQAFTCGKTRAMPSNPRIIPWSLPFPTATRWTKRSAPRRSR